MTLFFQIGPKLSEMYAYAGRVASSARATGRPLTADALTEAVLREYGGWDPVFQGHAIFADPETRRAAARLLAGIVLAME